MVPSEMAGEIETLSNKAAKALSQVLLCPVKSMGKGF